MFYFIRKFVVFMDFIQNVYDIRDGVWLYISDGLIYTWSQGWINFSSFDSSVRSKSTIKNSGQDWIKRISHKCTRQLCPF